MFNFFKSKSETIQELESQIDINKYQIVQGKDGTWAYNIYFLNKWALVPYAFKSKLEVIEYLLGVQKMDQEIENMEKNFN